MRRRSAKTARIFGLIMILMVSAWDMDAMRPHIAARSWYTLAFVALFLIVHVADYLTVGQLVTRIDPLALAVADGIAAAPDDATQQDQRTALPGLFAQKPAATYIWRRFFPQHRRQPALNLGQPTAKLYTFTAVTTTAAQASGAPYPVAQQRFIVEPD
jgi:hypothetical protein